MAFLCATAAHFAGGDPLAAFDKDAFRSRKKWYASFVFRLTGNGESSWKNGDDYGSTSWNILREVSGEFVLDNVSDHHLRSSDREEKKAKGRFVSWSATEGMSKVDWVIDDSVHHKVVTFGEAHSETTFTSSSRYRGAGATQIGRFKELKCDLEKMLFDMDLDDLESWNREPDAKPLMLTGEWDEFTRVTKVRAGGPIEKVRAGIFRQLPNCPEELRELLRNRKLEPSGDRIEMHAMVQVPRLPRFPSHPGSLRGEVNQNSEHATAPGRALELSLDIELSPTPPVKTLLILKPVGYDKWRPRCAGAEDEKGNDLQVVWRVEDEGGKGTTLSKVKRVVFELADVSHEPGVCMNWPIEPKTPAPPDLKFAGGTAAGRSVQAEGQKLVLTDAAAGAASGSLTVDCFDAGATGVLVAEATLDDGRVIHATVETSGEASLRIPDFEPGTRIAKFWREKNAPGKRDNADDEVEPKGDGQPGDGLTVYEEYRGFWVFARWDGTCEPKTKDLFIFNKVGDLATQGIQLFAGATGLKVHDLLQGDEAKADRVINFNMDGRDHLVDQHCLVVVPGGFTNKDDDGEVVSAGSQIVPIKDAEFGGPPKNTEYVTFLPSMLGTHPMKQRRNGEIYRVSSGEHVVAHELGHAVGIRHHGDKDTGNRKWTYRLNDDGTIRVLSDGSEITVLDEKTGQPVTRDRVFSGLEPGEEGVYWIGERNGQMSGDDACVMRYVNATTYRSMTDSSVLYYSGYAEIMGVRLCDSPAGTGVNMPTHEPQSRYFGADTGRGNCVHRFVISDHWEKLK